MVDVFSTQVLNRVVDNQPDTTSFLVDTFFPEVQVSEEETILFDVTNGRKLITPLVSPLAEGPIVNNIGYETDSFRPAYAKDRRFFDPKKLGKRTPGEKIGGELTRQQRLDKAIKANLAEQISMLGNRFEVMAGDVLSNGTATIVGDQYPSRLVNFNRRARNTVVRTGAARWGQAGVSPWDEVDAEAQELSDATGYGATDIIFTLDAWLLFKPSIPRETMDTKLDNLVMTEVALGYVRQPRDGVAYRGKSGPYRFWTYTGTFTNPETNATVSVLPPYTVLIGSASVDGVRHFGAIQDLEALQPRQYFVKSQPLWNPSRRELLMQSAPLLVPYRVNNIKRMTVN
jgi:hypothetical protein